MNVRAYGYVRNGASGLCLDSLNRDEDKTHNLGLYVCAVDRPLDVWTNQVRLILKSLKLYFFVFCIFLNLYFSFFCILYFVCLIQNTKYKIQKKYQKYQKMKNTKIQKKWRIQNKKYKNTKKYKYKIQIIEIIQKLRNCTSKPGAGADERGRAATGGELCHGARSGRSGRGRNGEVHRHRADPEAETESGPGGAQTTALEASKRRPDRQRRHRTVFDRPRRRLRRRPQDRRLRPQRSLPALVVPEVHRH